MVRQHNRLRSLSPPIEGTGGGRGGAPAGHHRSEADIKTIVCQPPAPAPAATPWQGCAGACRPPPDPAVGGQIRPPRRRCLDEPQQSNRRYLDHLQQLRQRPRCQTRWWHERLPNLTRGHQIWPRGVDPATVPALQLLRHHLVVPLQSRRRPLAIPHPRRRALTGTSPWCRSTSRLHRHRPRISPPNQHGTKTGKKASPPSYFHPPALPVTAQAAARRKGAGEVRGGRTAVTARVALGSDAGVPVDLPGKGILE
uniref:Uncharacterized protein n=1 Tax=Leersia perrieri TaxID=77586 RepID=A0A0D9VE47_9ORYZ